MKTYTSILGVENLKIIEFTEVHVWESLHYHALRLICWCVTKGKKAHILGETLQPPIIYLLIGKQRLTKSIDNVRFFVLASNNPNFHFPPNLNLNVVAQSCRHNMSVVMLKCWFYSASVLCWNNRTQTQYSAVQS